MMGLPVLGAGVQPPAHLVFPALPACSTQHLTSRQGAPCTFVPDVTFPDCCHQHPVQMVGCSEGRVPNSIPWCLPEGAEEARKAALSLQRLGGSWVQHGANREMCHDIPAETCGGGWAVPGCVLV